MPVSKKFRQYGPWILMVGGILLIFVVILIQFIGGYSTTNTESTAILKSKLTEITASDIPRVGVEEAKIAFDQGIAVIIDVRSENSFRSGHIKGAINIPEASLSSRIGELKPDEWIILYCT